MAAELEPGGDTLPLDLDPSAFVGPYSFPNIKRRRISAAILFAGGAICLGLYFGIEDSPLVNRGYLVGGVALLALTAYHLACGWDLKVTEKDALIAASRRAGIPLGHASAQLGWRGLRSRPTWRILGYSADNPPTKRVFALVDGLNGDIIADIVEDNPEDWREYPGT